MRILMTLVAAFCLASCVPSVTSRPPDERYRSDLYLSTGVAVFDCEEFTNTFDAWFGPSHAKCLAFGLYENHTGPVVPQGTRVRVLSIKEQQLVDTGGSIALLLIGEGKSVMRAYADWPKILDVLQAASANEERR